MAFLQYPPGAEVSSGALYAGVVAMQYKIDIAGNGRFGARAPAACRLALSTHKADADEILRSA